MFKLVVLSALLAVVAAKPGYLHDAGLAYAAPAVALPSAVSYQARTDVVSKPVIATAYAASPVVAHAGSVLAAAPVVAAAAPVVAAPAVAVPSAVSYQSRTDVVSKPVVATTYAASPVVAAYGSYGAYAAPAVVKSYDAYVAPAVIKSYGAYAAPAVVKSYGAYAAPAVVKSYGAYAAPGLVKSYGYAAPAHYW